ncbi:hypothetical protein MTO96_045021, partial [Rhipicephalus appendiculatus]
SRTTALSVSDEDVPKAEVGSNACAPVPPDSDSASAVIVALIVSSASGKLRENSVVEEDRGGCVPANDPAPLPLDSRSGLERDSSLTHDLMAGVSVDGSLPEDTSVLVVKMLFTVVLLFAVCWLPYHAYFLYVSHNPDVVYLDHIQHVYLAMYWLAMSHAMCNPLIYYCMNK